jgi:histidyl-tRNA synthetase
LPKPFKRYCIDKAWRYERPQAGRYREFYQCDVDTIGAKSPLADAELLACAGDALKAIGIDKFTFRVNSRVLMNELMEGAGVAKNQFVKVLRTLDKLGKISEEEIAKELRAFLSDASVDTLLGLMKLRGNWSAISKTMKICDENKKLIEDFLRYVKDFGIKNFVFDLSLARGLDYYTGFVFEIDAGKGLGSVGGGGRYDDMIGNFTGQKTPATGISLGLERIMEILKEKIKPKKSATKVFVIPIGINVIEIMQKLRNSGINADTDLMERGISKNLEYASKQEIPYVIFVGKEELKKKKLKLKDMKTGKEQMLALKDVIKKIKV